MTLLFNITAQQIVWENPCRNPVEGTVGKVMAQFTVDAEWDGLAVTVVFEHDGLNEQPEPMVWTGDPVIIPAVALSAEGRLRVGLVGYGSSGDVRLTTRRMANGIPVLPSAGTGGEAVDSEPELWEQILAIIGDLDELNTIVKDTLVAAINEAARSGSGGGLAFDLGETLKLTGSTLDVNTAKTVEDGNSLPVTSNAVSAAVEAIRVSLQQLAARLDALADSDDTTLDQLSEIVAYIKDNKSLIDQITSGKVSVSDIVNNLTSTETNKPLSANQGRALKALIDAISIPTNLPNPYALTFTGAAQGTYNGSKAVSIEIPVGETSEGTPGADGREVALRASGGYIQWQYVGETSWTNLIALSELTGEPGADGREIEIRSSGTYIQWRYVGETSWTNIVALSALKGDPGADGVGITSIDQTTTSTTDGGTNILTITLSDGAETTFRVKNGSKGGTGATPNLTIGDVTTLEPGNNAEATISGTAANPVLSLGIPAGAAGKTPTRGTDYWTEADRQSIVDDVIAALPTWAGGSY